MSPSIHSLAGLFAPEAVKAAWNTDDLAAIWKHQLASLLPGRTAVETEAANCQAAQHSSSTFGELLHGCEPSPEDLRATKDFGKSLLTRYSDLLPTEVATALYYLSILAARVRLNLRISRLDDNALAFAIQWLQGQTWLDDASRQLSRDAAARLTPI